VSSPSERWFRTLFAVASIAVAAFILYQSTRSNGDPTVPDLTTNEAYAGHLAVYAVLGFCAQTALLSRRLQTVLAVVAAATIFGACIEVYQSTLEGREASAYDALADLAGAAIGAFVAFAITPRWQRFLGQP
jgi:VanZ family protein